MLAALHAGFAVGLAKLISDQATAAFVPNQGPITRVGSESLFPNANEFIAVSVDSDGLFRKHHLLSYCTSISSAFLCFHLS
jgi:hypothetical protein